MYFDRQIRILHWNAQGISNISSAKQLDIFLKQEHIDIAMLNKTFLKNHHKLHLDGYKIHRNDRIDAAKGGVAIAIKLTIKHTLTKKILRIHLQQVILRLWWVIFEKVTHSR